MNVYVVAGWDLPYDDPDLVLGLLQTFSLNISIDKTLNWKTLCDFAAIETSPLYVCEDKKTLILGQVLACWDSELTQMDFKDITQLDIINLNLNRYRQSDPIKPYIMNTTSIIVGCFVMLTPDG